MRVIVTLFSLVIVRTKRMTSCWLKFIFFYFVGVMMLELQVVFGVAVLQVVFGVTVLRVKFGVTVLLCIELCVNQKADDFKMK